MSDAAPEQLARALLLRGVSGEIVHSPADGLTVVVDDEVQLEAAAEVVVKFFPGTGPRRSSNA